MLSNQSVRANEEIVIIPQYYIVSDHCYCYFSVFIFTLGRDEICDGHAPRWLYYCAHTLVFAHMFSICSAITEWGASLISNFLRQFLYIFHIVCSFSFFYFYLLADWRWLQPKYRWCTRYAYTRAAEHFDAYEMCRNAAPTAKPNEQTKKNKHNNNNSKRQ